MSSNFNKWIQSNIDMSISEETIGLMEEAWNAAINNVFCGFVGIENNYYEYNG